MQDAFPCHSAGSETVKVGDTTSLGSVSNDVEKVGSLRLTIAGGITPPNPLASLKSALPSKPDPKALAQSALTGGSPAAALKSAIPSPEAMKSSLQNALKPPSLESLLSGQITRNVGEFYKKKVGGAVIALAGGGISLMATKLLAELVGGARILVASKESINANSSGKFIRLVGGMINRKAGKDITTSAHDSKVTIGGNATFTAKDKVELRGQKIEITAREKVHLEKAGLTIDMTPTKITISGDLKLKSKDKVNVHGTPDNVSQ